LPVLGDPDGKVGRVGDDLGKEALVLGGEVLHEDVGQAAVRRDPLEEPLECLEAACRGADPNDEEALPSSARHSTSCASEALVWKGIRGPDVLV
jgi:hypothetical protein